MTLFGLLRTAPDALRADFRKHYGLNLNQSIQRDWKEAADLAACIPPDKTSAVYRSVHKDTWRWSDADHLMAMQVDALRLLVWLKTEDATKKPPRNRPTPIPRPGISEKQKEAEGRFKDVQARSPEELERRLAMPRKAIAKG